METENYRSARDQTPANPGVPEQAGQALPQGVGGDRVAPGPGPVVDEGHQAAVKLEDLAERHGLMPVRLPRNSCSASAENLLRKLGRSATGPEPWIPVGTMGPLLVIGHYNPAFTEAMGVPPCLAIRVLIGSPTT